MSCLHVSPGQQAGAVGIDEGVAMGTERDGMLVEEGGRAGAKAGHETEEAVRGDLSCSQSDERSCRATESA